MYFRRRLIALLLAGCFTLQVTATDDLPELGDVASSELSLSAEKKIGQQIMHEIRWREVSYLDDPDVEAYLNQLGGRLTAVSADPGFGFQFFAINDPSINAFAMPGGFIGVHTGLILTAQAESELAGVLAHEISHVTQRHIARQVFQSKQMSMAAMLAMGLALLAARSSTQGAGAAMATAQAGMVSAQLAFSRDFEREADRLGFDILRKAGFDVRGMSVFFQRLQAATRLYENNATAYLRTHPLTGERVTDMQNREQTLGYRQVADSADFLLVRTRLRAMLGTPAEALKDMENLWQEKKYAAEGAAHYGLAVALMRNRDWSRAEQELLNVRKLRLASPMVEHALAEVKMERGESDAALAIYREAMQRYPQNMALVYGNASTLVKSRRFSEAQRFLEQQLQVYSQDVRLHNLRAEAYAGQGKQALQHQALAESFALQAMTAEAIEQLTQAQKAGDANFYEMSAIDARLRELKRRYLEEMKDKRN